MRTAAATAPKRRLRLAKAPMLRAGVVIAGVLLAGGAAAEPPPLPQDLSAYRVGSVYSGLVIADPSTQAMELDDFANPAMLWVETAKELWRTPDGEAGKSCADCHQTPDSLAHAGTHYPDTDPDSGVFLTLEDRINTCRQRHMNAMPWAYESAPLLGMTALVKMQARGQPVAVRIDGPNAAWFARGEQVYQRRIGQMRLSCQDCHQRHEGEFLRAEQLSQGQSNGFPTYRLKWQELGSLQRRFQECNNNIRALPLPSGADDYRALELYLAWRGQGLLIETPAVRK